MPVKIWEADHEDHPYSRIKTGWDRILTAEEYRQEAEELDADLDAVLDAALSQVATHVTDDIPQEFKRAWAVGRALMEAGVFASPALANERRELLWRALARKCRIGARSSGDVDRRWLNLRPRSAGEPREPRREGGRLDYFEMCRWLAEQDFEDAVATFGGHVRNVWQMLERPALRPLVLRRAFKAWLETLPDKPRRSLLEPRTFPELMKALRRRWPDRGPGSAKRPTHFAEDDLSTEIASVLEPFVTAGKTG